MTKQEFMKNWPAANGLPYGFRRCEYLESTGNGAYINTGCATTSELSVEFECLVSTEVNAAACGALEQMTTGGYKRHHYSPYREQSYWLMASASPVSNIGSTNPMPGIFIYWKIDAQKRVWESAYNINGTQYSSSGTFDTTSFSAELPYCIFGRPTVKMSERQTRPCKFKFFNLWGTHGIDRMYIPALALAGTAYTDGNSGLPVTAAADKPGMYDTVSKRFFVNRGTGADFLYKLA